jgi:hypothetical protein
MSKPIVFPGCDGAERWGGTDENARAVGDAGKRGELKNINAVQTLRAPDNLPIRSIPPIMPDQHNQFRE